jgi:type I restriction-modification system DNA methylase subunit
MLTQEQLQPIAQLVEHYERLSDADRRRYSETETRTNFIDRLFLALGWPVYDRDHVERETTVAEGKRPDYIFKLHGVPRLFLEAKPLRDDVYNLQYARDAITKAYNKGVPWAGVTNFAALVIFDAQEELRPGAPPARVLDLTYPDYLHADSALHYLTLQALDQRLLEQQAQRTGTRPRGVPIEKRLYESMRQWRESLFNHMRAALDWKTDAQLRTGDEAIQRLIDRLIFLRNCEDRDIGTTDLRALLHRIRSRDRNVRVTDSLLRLFAEAAATYDSELFQTDALIDVLLQGLATRTDVDDTLAEIVEGLYSVPRSYAQYDFAQMDADVLGQVYEQYLGYVPQYMRQLAAQEPLPGFPAQEITVDAKRQRRKEHGIYYTPRWVVHYIVQQTLGRFLEESRNNEEAIANLTILDPACGSGSFLIHAYETLLQHHAARMGGDVGHLDTRTREWILTHNIFGVDLDPQAVEIARLNLLIRMVRQQEQLPPLADNIRLGNSLISGGDAELRPYFGDAWQDKRPFDWDQEFQEIMARGGFDIVIGNPPYVRIQTLPRDEVAHYNERYEAATGSYDIYALFVERGLRLLRPGGMLGFIIPNKFMQAQYGKGLRRLLADSRSVSKIVDFGDAQIFESGTNYTCLLFVTKTHQRSIIYVPAADYLRDRPDAPNITEIDQLGFPTAPKSEDRPWIFSASSHSRLLSKLQGYPKLASITRGIFQGVITGADRVFILHIVSTDQQRGIVTVKSDATGRPHEIEQSIARPMVKGSRHVHRYQIDTPDLVLLFPYRANGDAARLLTPDEMSALHPKAWEYLKANRRRLESREEGKWRGRSWYGYSRIQNMFDFQKPKLLVPYMVDRVRAGYDPAGGIYMVNVTTGGYGIALNRSQLYPFVLALLNSSLAHFCLKLTATRHAGNYYGCTNAALGALPLPPVEAETLASDKRHGQLVQLVHRMLDLHQRLAAKGDLHDSEREQIERDIAHTDREIDDLVYDLYGLTTEERALIEAEVRR